MFRWTAQARISSVQQFPLSASTWFVQRTVGSFEVRNLPGKTGGQRHQAWLLLYKDGIRVHLLKD